MRKIFLSFSTGFALCCVLLCYLLPEPPAALAAALGFFALSAAALALFSGATLLRAVCAAAAGACIASLLMAAQSQRSLSFAGEFSRENTVRALVTDFPQESGSYSSSVRVKLFSGGKYRAGAVVYLTGNPPLRPGDEIEFTAALSAPGGGYGRWLRANGCILAGSGGTVGITSRGGVSLSNASAYLRNAALEKTGSLFWKYSGFFGALLFGDKTGLDPSFVLHAGASGTAHIYAVSGLHMSFLAAAVMLLSGRRRRLAPLFGIPAMLVFAAVCGFTPSVVRSAIMHSAVLAGFSLRRETDTFTSLMLALLVILLINPFAAADIRLQFSFSAVLALIFIAPLFARAAAAIPVPKSRRARQAFLFARGTAVSTLSVQIFTLPLTAAYFSSFSFTAMLANILILPVISFVFLGGLAAVILSFIWRPLGMIVSAAVFPGAAYVTSLTDLLGSLPFSSVGITSAVACWLVFAYLCGTAAAIIKPRRAFLRASSLIILTLILALSAEALAARRRFSVDILDVGQGQCVILSAGGRTAVVDCGGRSGTEAAAALASALTSRNIPDVDLLLLTSSLPHHSSGAAEALSELRVRRTVRCGLALREAEFPCESVFTDSLFELGELKIYLLMPLGGEPAAVYARYRGAGVFIQGDLDAESCEYMLRTRKIGSAGILVAGRHGSAISENIMKTISPRYVIISGNEPGDNSTASRGDISFTVIGGRIFEGRR